MFEYKSEILKTGLKVVKDKANEADVAQFNDVFNEQAKEGWELVTYSYMSEVFGVRAALLATFRRQK